MSTNRSYYLLSENALRAAIDALDAKAEDLEKRAAECQQAADAGESNALIADYTPVAAILRDNAKRYRIAQHEFLLLLEDED